MPAFPPNYLPPVVYPTQHQVVKNQFTNIVPHIHPSHTTTVNQTKFVHKHFCPHTQSVVNEVCHEHVNCCNPCHPRPRRFF